MASISGVLHTTAPPSSLQGFFPKVVFLAPHVVAPAVQMTMAVAFVMGMTSPHEMASRCNAEEQIPVAKAVTR